MLHKTTFVVLVLVALLTMQCEEAREPVVYEKISGLAQKGPYVIGSSILVNDLNSELAQTGAVYTTQIRDNTGKFEIENISLSSGYVQLKADGFYFNEVRGVLSGAQLTLYALADVTEKQALNVNILTTLEKPRVEYLVAEGRSFARAKRQALEELLTAFNMELAEDEYSELLDISGTSADDAVLLAISIIMQGSLSVANLSENIALISEDLKEDGQINNESLLRSLFISSKELDYEKIRKKLELRYADMGVSLSVPGFESQIDSFLELMDFEIPSSEDYPEQGFYGRNILHQGRSDDTLFADQNYSMAVDLGLGNSLKVCMKNGWWGYGASSVTNWQISDYTDNSQCFQSVVDGSYCDLKVVFVPDTLNSQERITVDYYENGSETPSFTKTLYIIQK